MHTDSFGWKTNNWPLGEICFSFLSNKNELSLRRRTNVRDISFANLLTMISIRLIPHFCFWKRKTTTIKQTKIKKKLVAYQVQRLRQDLKRGAICSVVPSTCMDEVDTKLGGCEEVTQSRLPPLRLVCWVPNTNASFSCNLTSLFPWKSNHATIL